MERRVFTSYVPASAIINAEGSTGPIGSAVTISLSPGWWRFHTLAAVNRLDIWTPCQPATAWTELISFTAKGAYIDILIIESSYRPTAIGTLYWLGKVEQKDKITNAMAKLNPGFIITTSGEGRERDRRGKFFESFVP